MNRAMTMELTAGRETDRYIRIAFFSIVTFAAALIRVQTPFTPVPFTLQTFVVFMASYYLGTKDNMVSQASYIIAGFIGAPVFAAGLAGAAAVAGPTAGYLAGFVLAGAMMSRMISGTAKLSFIKAAAIFSLGSLVILTLGTLHLAVAYGLGFSKAFAAGFAPFIGVEAMKVAAAAAFFKLRK